MSVVPEPNQEQTLNEGLVDHHAGADMVDSVVELASASAPPRVRSRGRPAKNRLKSPIESPGSKKRKRPAAAAPRIAVRKLKRLKAAARGEVVSAAYAVLLITMPRRAQRTHSETRRLLPLGSARPAVERGTTVAPVAACPPTLLLAVVDSVCFSCWVPIHISVVSYFFLETSSERRGLLAIYL